MTKIACFRFGLEISPNKFVREIQIRFRCLRFSVSPYLLERYLTTRSCIEWYYFDSKTGTVASERGIKFVVDTVPLLYHNAPCCSKLAPRRLLTACLYVSNVCPFVPTERVSRFNSSPAARKSLASNRTRTTRNFRSGSGVIVSRCIKIVERCDKGAVFDNGRVQQNAKENHWCRFVRVRGA